MAKDDKVKKPRTDKRKNVWKVAEVLATNPNKTEREIAKEAWVSNWTAHNAKLELEQTWAKDATIAYIVWASKDRLKRVSKVFDQIVKDAEEELFEKDGSRKFVEMETKSWEIVMAKTQLPIKEKVLLKDFSRDDMARINVLWGSITDDQWWLVWLDAVLSSIWIQRPDITK